MIQKIKQFIIVAVSGFALLIPAIVAPAVVYAADSVQQGLCLGTNEALPGNTGIGQGTVDKCGTASTDGTAGSIGTLAAKIVNIFSIIVGIAAVIMIIYGGFRYVVSGGESGSVSTAKNTLIYAIVGLVIVALAQFIVHFVLNQINSSNLNQSGV